MERTGQLPVTSAVLTNEYSKAILDFSDIARGSYSYYIRLELVGAGPQTVRVQSLNIRSYVQVSKFVFPMLKAGRVNRLAYTDFNHGTSQVQINIRAWQSPASDLMSDTEPDSVTRAPFTVSSVVSNVRELPDNPYFGSAQAVIDGNTNTYASPANSAFDYTLTLSRPAYVSAVNIIWGKFGFGPPAVETWQLWGREPGHNQWKVIARGGFPDSSYTVIPVRQVYARLRVSAQSSDSGIGLAEVHIYGYRNSQWTPAQD